MSQYDNTNRGVLFDNDRKEKDTHPDMQGTLNINGVDHWFSGWWKDARDGSEFLSLSIGKPKEQQGERRAPAPQSHRGSNRPSQRQAPAPAKAAKPAPAGSGFDDMDSDMPF